MNEAISLEAAFRPVWPFVVALAAAAVSAWPIYRLLQRIGSRQTVSEYVPEHAAKQGTPTMGGLIVLVGIVAGSAAAPDNSLAFWTVCFFALIYGLIGFVDDFVIPKRTGTKRGLGWIPKLVLQILPAVLVSFLTSGQTATPLRVAVEVFVILFFVNAFNFADGLDGLAASILIFMGLSAAAIGLVIGAQLTPVIGALLVGAVIPFLFFNAPPAKVFMGDVGSMAVGFLLSTAALDIFHGGTRAQFDPIMLVLLIGLWAGVMIAELVPVPLQILSVKLRKKKVFAKTPIHHAFEVKGVPETRIVWHFALVQLVLGILAAGWAVGLAAGAKP